MGQSKWLMVPPPKKKEKKKKLELGRHTYLINKKE
jgi:hypothetical protein